MVAIARKRTGRATRMKACEGCGQMKMMRPDVRFCSKACGSKASKWNARRGAASRDRRSNQRASKLVGSLKQCTECGCHFSTWFKNIAKTCSAECQYRRMLRIDIEKYESVATRYEKHCDRCGKEFTTIISKATFCSHACSHAEHNRRRKVKLKGGAVGRVSRRIVWERDNGNCWICGKPCSRKYTSTDMMAPTIDHVIPISKGGSHTMDNVRLAHLICNSAKSDKLHEGGEVGDV